MPVVLKPLIRSAALTDLGAIAVLCREHAAFEQAPRPVNVDDKALERALFGEPPMLRALVAVAGQAIVAYATYTFDCSTWRLAPYVHLDCLFVETSHRGRGIGRQLMGALADIAEQQACDTIEWQTPAWNESAVAFYAHLGASASPKMRFRWSLV